MTRLTREQHELVQRRRALLKQSRSMIEHDRCGPDLKARCGCVFVPWRHVDWRGRESMGFGLVIECDQAQRLFEIAIRNEKTSQWEAHVYLAREDADNQLDEIVKLIVAQRKAKYVPDHES